MLRLWNVNFPHHPGPSASLGLERCLCDLFLVEELFVLGRTVQRRGRALVLLDGLGDGVEVAGADFALVFHSREALLRGGEFGFLHLHEGRHAAPRIAVCEIEHAVVQRMETGQR